jgi:hypothetical protein
MNRRQKNPIGTVSHITIHKPSTIINTVHTNRYMKLVSWRYHELLLGSHANYNVGYNTGDHS